MTHLLLVAHLRLRILVPICTQVRALLARLLHALRLLAVHVLLLVIVHRHLAVCGPFWRFLRHVAGLIAADLAVVLLFVSNSRWHLVMMWLVDHRVVVRLPFALAEAPLAFRRDGLVDAHRPVVQPLGRQDLAVVEKNRRVVDRCVAGVVHRVVQEAVFVFLLGVLVLHARVVRTVAQRLADDEGVVGRGHDRLVLRVARQNWSLILRMVLLDVFLVGLLRQSHILLFECLLSLHLHLCLNIRPVFVVIRSLMRVLTSTCLLCAHLLLGGLLPQIIPLDAVRHLVEGIHLLLHV